LVALSFLEHLSAGEIDAALDLIADDVVWWLAGREYLDTAHAQEIIVGSIPA
jgi:hypothetical protein